MKEENLSHCEGNYNNLTGECVLLQNRLKWI